MPPEFARLLSALEYVERRQILTALARTTEPVAVPIDTGAFDVDRSPGSESVATEIRLDILNYHLPELAEYGYVTFDEGEQIVTRGPRFAEIRPFLGLSNGHDHADDSA